MSEELGYHEIMVIVGGNAYRLNTDPEGELYLEDAPIIITDLESMTERVSDEWGPVDFDSIDDEDKRRCLAIEATLIRLFNHQASDWDTRY